MRLDLLGDRPTRNVISNRASGSRRHPKAHLGFCLAFALILALPVMVSAASFDELYTVSVEPDPGLSGEQQRIDAIRRGMTELLTRITGRRRSPADPNIAALVRNATNYYNAYSPLAGEIRISFLRSQVNDALTQLNEPIWGDERPLTLVWLAVDFGDGQRSELGGIANAAGFRPDQLDSQTSEPLDADSQDLFDTLVEEFLDVADERGLPLVLPRLDMQDRQLVRFADVWGGFDPFVSRAAERYDADAILIARLGLADSATELRWILRRGDLLEDFASSDLRSGIDRLADQFASEFTISGDMRETWLTIRNIRTWPDFGRVDEYLRSVSVVDDVFIRSWSTNGELLLRVDARGDQSQLRQILALGGTLIPWAPTGTTLNSVPQDIDQLIFVPEWLSESSEIAEAP